MRPVLITSGGCEEPVDGVRTISNFSTGRTGAFLAEFFAGKGCEVVLVKAVKAVCPQNSPENKTGSIQIREFRSFSDLSNILCNLAGDGVNPGIVLFAAAISDFTVATVQIGDSVYQPGELDKINSSGNEKILIELGRNPKMIDNIKDLYPSAILTGFKLTRNDNEKQREEAVVELARHSRADFIVQNDLSEISADKHCFRLYARKGTEVTTVNEGSNKKALAAALYEIYSKREAIR